jgi:hypothetical protein
MTVATRVSVADPNKDIVSPAVRGLKGTRPRGLLETRVGGDDREEALGLLGVPDLCRIS